MIAFNGRAGVAIGDSSADPSNDNAIIDNSIRSNIGLGIDLGDDGVTPNTPCGRGSGPNLLQNAPVLTSVTVAGTAGTTILGSLNAAPNATYLVEFFANPQCDPSGSGQGEFGVGSVSVVTGGDCRADFEAHFASITLGLSATATATDAAGNTSEFSACRMVAAAPTTTPTSAPTSTPSSTPVVTKTPTPAAQVTVPTLSEEFLVFLGLTLGLLGVILLRRF